MCFCWTKEWNIQCYIQSRTTDIHCQCWCHNPGYTKHCVGPKIWPFNESVFLYLNQAFPLLSLKKIWSTEWNRKPHFPCYKQYSQFGILCKNAPIFEKDSLRIAMISDYMIDMIGNQNHLSYFLQKYLRAYLKSIQW